MKRPLIIHFGPYCKYLIVVTVIHGKIMDDTWWMFKWQDLSFGYILYYLKADILALSWLSDFQCYLHGRALCSTRQISTIDHTAIINMKPINYDYNSIWEESLHHPENVHQTCFVMCWISTTVGGMESQSCLFMWRVSWAGYHTLLLSNQVYNLGLRVEW